MNGEFVMIDDIPVEIDGEKNLLSLIRKAGIDLPTFCYHSELSVYGACRMCMVENKRGGMEAACSTPPRAGMEIYTNTPKLRKYRKMILELLLSDHCSDCTTCGKNGDCRLQELAQRYGINRLRFPNTADEPKPDASSLCIERDASKCILCGDCVRMCEEVQNVGVIDFMYRGSKMEVGTTFGVPIAETRCVGCGQCASVCPTGAIVVKNDTDRVWKLLHDPECLVVAQVAPAVRVGLGGKLGQKDGENVMGKIVAALKRMGFDLVFDTATGADLTVVEESREFLERLSAGEDLPLFTSCCPAWVQYAEKEHPELLPNISTCRSPMEMFASVVKERYKDGGRRVAVVGVMPCTAKKYEAAREEFTKDGVPQVDCVITTQELIRMIRESGIVFPELEPEGVDTPFGIQSGAGIIFGVTGGVTEAVIRRLSENKSVSALRTIAFNGVRGMKGLKETTLEYKGREVKIAVVSGLGNAEKLIKKIRGGEARYDFVEVMACPGGCIAGAGQPSADLEGKKRRGEGLYAADRMCGVKRSEENPVVTSLYGSMLRDGGAHSLLHVKYSPKPAGTLSASDFAAER